MKTSFGADVLRLRFHWKAAAESECFLNCQSGACMSLTQLCCCLWTALNGTEIFSSFTAILPFCPSHSSPWGILSVHETETLSNLVAYHQGSLKGINVVALFLFKCKAVLIPLWGYDSMAQFYCAGKQDPKDLLTHLAKVISKSRGRWCHGQILHCFWGILICIYNWQPYLPVTIVFCMLTCLNGVWESVTSCSVWGFCWNWLICYG